MEKELKEKELTPLPVVCSLTGTFAVISVMIGGVTERMAPDSNFLVNGTTNGTETVDTEAQNAYRVKIACSLTVLTGIFQVCFPVCTH